jgi:hypothetical protein
MKHTSLLILAAWLFLLPSCSKVIKPDPPKPEDSVIPEFEVRQSSFNLPIELDMGHLQGLINRKLETKLYSGTGIDVGYGVSIDLEILKRNNIQLSTFDGSLMTKVPLIVRGTAHMGKEVMGINLKRDQPFNTDLDISTGTLLTISDDWGVSTRTESDFQMDGPYISVFGKSISLGKIARPILKKQLPYINTMIDDYIKNSFNLKEQMTTLCDQMREPMLLSDDPSPTWLMVQPTRFSYAPPESIGFNRLVFNIGMNSTFQTFIGDKPQTRMASELPRLEQSYMRGNTFDLALPIAVSMNEAEKMANANIAGQTYEMSKKRTMTVNKVNLYGKADKMVIKLNFKSKKIKGDLYLLGRPTYDATTKTLEFKDIDVSTSTNNAIANSAGWLADKLFLKKIQQQLKYDLTSYIDDARNQAQASLSQYELQENLVLKGTINELTVEKIDIQRNFIFLTTSVKGTMGVTTRE